MKYSKDILVKRLAREQNARLEAERLLEEKSRELYSINHHLAQLAGSLADKSAKLDAIFQHTSAGILQIDAKGHVLEANASADAIFGRKDTGLIGVNIFDHVSCEARLLIERLRVAHGDELECDNMREDVVGLRDGGEEFPLELAVEFLDGGESETMVWICRDISMRREAEKQRAVLQTETSHVQKMESLGTLASGIAHEINTPVQYVTDNVKFMSESIEDLERLLTKYADIVSKIAEHEAVKDGLQAVRDLEDEIDLEFLREELPEASEHAQQGLKQIAEIVAAVKSFAHPGVEEKSVIDINTAISTTSTVCRNQWKYVSSLEMELDAAAPKTLGCAGEINQVILNLIVNAAHAIEEAKRDELGVIRIETSSDADWVTVRVSDNGCGIPDSVAKKVFDPFFTTKPVGKGTGQGLALCFSIITQKHGGTLSFESEPGEGTTFIIRLPASQEEQHAA